MSKATDYEEKSKQIMQKIEEKMAAIRHKIVIMSGKGGVGKTTVAGGLTIALARAGKGVGILDTDIHGPNVSLMLGLEGQRLGGHEETIEPLVTGDGVKAVSMANLLPNADTPVIWRGPAKLHAIRQFLSDVSWGNLDYLVIDSPPGTGDEPLTIAQSVPGLDGAVIVTTPQDMALLDSRKCINFAHQVNMPVIGIVENMSGMTCPHCGGKIEPFKTGGGERAAKEMNVPFLGPIPMDPYVVESSDRGAPFFEPGSETAKAFDAIVENIVKTMGE